MTTLRNRIRCPSCEETWFAKDYDVAASIASNGCPHCEVLMGVTPDVPTTERASGEIVEVATDGGQTVDGPDAAERVDPVDLRKDYHLLRPFESTLREDAAGESNARLSGHLSLAADSVEDAVYHLRKYLAARDALDEPEEREVATDGGFVSDHPDAVWCPDCQRYRVDCTHQR